MRQTFRTWATILVMVLAWSIQFNLVVDYKTSKYLKEELELALHDAGLFINLGQLSEGKIVFDENLAYQAFVNSIEKNTKLNNLQPTATTYYQDAFTVVTFEVFDDSNTTFPFQYVHPTLNYQKTFYGPSIYVVVETYGPRFFQGSKKLLRRDAAFTYKP